MAYSQLCIARGLGRGQVWRPWPQKGTQWGGKGLICMDPSGGNMAYPLGTHIDCSCDCSEENMLALPTRCTIFFFLKWRVAYVFCFDLRLGHWNESERKWRCSKPTQSILCVNLWNPSFIKIVYTKHSEKCQSGTCLTSTRTTYAVVYYFVSTYEIQVLLGLFIRNIVKKCQSGPD